jgi:hypothetical protein
MRISRKTRTVPTGPQAHDAGALAAWLNERCGATDQGAAGSECIRPPHAYGDHADALGLSYDNDADITREDF